MKYNYNPEPTQQTFGPKPAGDYTFTVTECGEPSLNSNWNWVLPVRLAVGDDKATVFDNPWSRSEKSPNQDGRDGIAKFLLAINMAPARGKDPDWHACVGKKGKVRLKVEVATQGTLSGKEVNRVDYYHAPKQASSDVMKSQSASASEFLKARAKGEIASGGSEPEPDSIPY